VLLASPLNYLVLNALADGPRQQAALRQQAGSPAQTTLRAQLGKLSAIGAIEKHRRNRFPGTLEYELTGAGRDLLFVVTVLEDWLRHAPRGPLSLDSTAAKAAVKALAEGWSTTMLRALGAGPRSLTELDRVIASLSYPSLERRLAAMRLAGMVDNRPSNGRGTPYAVTEWLRRGLAPLAAAARWERRHEPRATTPIGRLDIETAFLLAAPMLRPLDGLHGSCRLAAELGDGKKRRLAGVVVELADGAVGSCTTSLNGDVEAWALGPPTAWLGAVIEGDVDGLELGGDYALARALVERLHEVLFRTNPIPALDSDRTIEEDELN
jgi:DNA-binding HxlR family transcriptional regulator